MFKKENQPISSGTIEELLKLDNTLKLRIVKYQSEFITKRVPSKRSLERWQYRHACGYVKGLKYASNIISLLLSRERID